MISKTKIFVSYARKEERLANAMVQYFEEQDIECFIDKRNILPGTKYSEEIIKGIENSDVVVLILTKESNISDNVRNEIDTAANFKKKIIVFRVENISLSKSLQFYLATCQWFDAFPYRGEQYFEQLTGYVKGLPVPPFSPKIIKQKKIVIRILQSYSLLSLVLLFTFGLRILKDYATVNVTNHRGVRYVDAIRMSGLTDIESRKWGKMYNIAPPIEFYEDAKREIFVYGVTLSTTLENHREYLRAALGRGLKIRLLLLNPQSADSFAVKNINKRMQTFANSIQNSLSIISNDTAMFHNKNMEVRFTDNIYPLVGMMIDGDIEAGEKPIDSGAIIRVSPYFRSLNHNDWYLQFSRSGKDIDAFVDFAAEYRQYWKFAQTYNDVIKKITTQ